mgnify:CR=1 FL=1
MIVEVKLEIPKYNDEVGLQSSWVDGFIIKTDIIENQIQIHANKAGLISLAKQLLSLAQDETQLAVTTISMITIAWKQAQMNLLFQKFDAKRRKPKYRFL